MPIIFFKMIGNKYMNETVQNILIKSSILIVKALEKLKSFFWKFNPDIYNWRFFGRSRINLYGIIYFLLIYKPIQFYPPLNSVNSVSHRTSNSTLSGVPHVL